MSQLEQTEHRFLPLDGRSPARRVDYVQAHRGCHRKVAVMSVVGLALTSLPVVDEETNTGGRAGCNERGSWGNIWENR